MGGEAAKTAREGGVLRARLLRTASTAEAPPSSDAATVPAPPPPSLERIAATAAARAALSASGLPATAEAVRWRGASLAELPELLPERSLIAVIEAPGDRLGVAVVCPSLLGSLIEMQAMGRVTARPVAARRPTRADATIAAEFINRLLGEVGRATQALPGQTALIGYRYSSYLDDPRPLALMLDDCGFRTVHVELRLGAGGERRGALFLAVPSTTEGAAPDRQAAEGAKAVAVARITSPAAPFASSADTRLAAAVRHAPVPLVAVLCRRQITLRELRALKPGATLALPRATLSDASLETLRGQHLARAKLGEANGFYAMRLLDPSRRVAPHVPDAVREVRDPVPGSVGDAASAPSPPQSDAGLPRASAMPDLAPIVEPPIADLGGPDAFRAVDDARPAAVVPLQRLP